MGSLRLGCYFIIPTTFIPVTICLFIWKDLKPWSSLLLCRDTLAFRPILQISIFLSACCHYSVTVLRDDEAAGSLRGTCHHGFVLCECSAFTRTCARAHTGARFVSWNRFQSHLWLIVSFQWQWCMLLQQLLQEQATNERGKKNPPGYLFCHCAERSRLNGLRRMSKCQTPSSRLQPGRTDNCSNFSDLGLNVKIK